MQNVHRELAKPPQTTEQPHEQTKPWSEITLKRLGCSERIPANLTDKKSEVSLMWACKELYIYLKHNLENCNPVKYCSCCLVFTTRSSSGKKDHPPARTQLISKLFKKENIKDVNSFNRFIEREVRKFPLHQQFQPGLNLNHDPELQREDDPLLLLT